MKKYKEWLTNEIEIMESETSENYPHEQMVEREVVLNLINQLDEPEVKQIKELDSYNDELIRDNNQLRNALDSQKVLSQEWIKDNQLMKLGPEGVVYYVAVENLQNLLLPKQEELESRIKGLIKAYKQEEDAYGELENGWIRGFIEDLKNLVEEEQKYVVPIDEKHALCKFTDVVWRICKESTDKLYLEDYFKFTEQEIKDYDERFWPFAVKVEELEE